MVTAPAGLREELRSLTLTELLRLAARWASGAEPGTHLAVCKHVLAAWPDVTSS